MRWRKALVVGLVVAAGAAVAEMEGGVPNGPPDLNRVNQTFALDVSEHRSAVTAVFFCRVTRRRWPVAVRAAAVALRADGW